MSLGRIRAELDKLALFAAGEPAITAKHVKEMVLPESGPGEDFALGNVEVNAAAAVRPLFRPSLITTALLIAGAPCLIPAGRSLP